VSSNSLAPASAAPSLACGTCVDRRTFLAQSSLAAIGAALVGACGDGLTSPGGVETGTANLADYPALSVVGGVARITGTVIAVVRTDTSTYRAFSMTCPHRGTTISITSSGFRCPNHGATFNRTGQWIGGQATSSLRELSVSYNADAQTLTIG
jgi:nitrite reductase/ring-hydroxylating ferredoxin subunit